MQNKRDLYRNSNASINAVHETLLSPDYHIDQKLRFYSPENMLYRQMVEMNIYTRIKEFVRSNKTQRIKILDLGAGSCHNIVHLNNYLKKNSIEATIYGSDWSDSTGRIIEQLKENKNHANLNFVKIDYFDPKT